MLSYYYIEMVENLSHLENRNCGDIRKTNQDDRVERASAITKLAGFSVTVLLYVDEILDLV